MKMKTITAISGFMLLCHGLFANNIMTTNIKLTGQNTGSHTTQVQFDISWENSWRTSSGPANWDAAWVFVKYRVNGVGPWLHATLNNSGAVAPSGSAVDVGLLTPSTTFDATTNPGVGAFVHRSVNGSGTFSLTGVQLQWNYGANTVGDNDLVDIQVYAIEEVYVPAGSFSVGSGAGSSTAAEYGSFYTYNSATPAVDTNPYVIGSEAAITVGATNGSLNYTINTVTVGDGLGPIPAAFPKGYAAFYCMKYELSQQGFADFLNSLNYFQSHNHYDYNSNIGISRYAIDTVQGNSTFISRAPYIACNFLSWNDLAAYLDWAGLRPMSELEFEKACRGTLTPTPNENAWGTAVSDNHFYALTNRDAVNEYTTALNTASGIGNVSCYNTVGAYTIGGTPGPLRVGIFAASAVGLQSVSRSTVGATFYGIMEMSGNVYERAITVGRPAGRSFVGSHGNGNLDANGNATNSDWPSLTTAIGVGVRGGSWNTPNATDSLSVSNRRFAAGAALLSYNPLRNPYWGGRGVRTAP